MRMPTKASSPNAIQWSTGAIHWLMVEPTSQPNIGISAWNNPK